MQRHALKDMIGGWFVGHFTPAVLHTDQVEVAVKHYRAGDREARHHHKLADEVTLVAAGAVRMAGEVFRAGEIVHLAPGESTEFEALEETTTVVVKRPSVAGDKYLD